MSRTAGRGGFTLVEVLLTLAIFSVILLLLLSSFTGVERARERVPPVSWKTGETGESISLSGLAVR